MWNGGHIDRDKRAGPPGAQLMNGLCNQFFARSAFSRNQNCQVVPQNTCNHAIHVLHRLAAAD